MDNTDNRVVIQNTFMEKIAAILFPLLGLFFLIQIIRHLFLKGIAHFKLLKILFPTKLNSINSYWELMWSTAYFKLGFELAFWFSIPFYYSKFARRTLEEDSLVYHNRLIANNKKLCLYGLLFFIDMAMLWLAIYYFKGSD